MGRWKTLTFPEALLIEAICARYDHPTMEGPGCHLCPLAILCKQISVSGEEASRTDWEKQMARLAENIIDRTDTKRRQRR